MAEMFARSDSRFDAARRLAGTDLAEALRDSRRRSLALVDELDDAQWRVPQQAGINPIAWELAHLAWFGEFWILRGPHRADAAGLIHAARPARLAGPDALFDSARLAHGQRWQAALPARAELLERLEVQLEACLQALHLREADDAGLYFHRLSLFHEDMHGEALTWLRAALGYPAPPGPALAPRPVATPLQIEGAEVRLGWPRGRPGFAFDNELPGVRQVLPPYEIDSQVVTAGQYLRFVEAGGY
ncbi:MAG TPA: DinB family protein, partial [Roseateles sp.]|nr:DinB family protein [Roseateles sp.]